MYEHNEGRPPSMKDVNEILGKIRQASTTNPPISALQNRALMQAKSLGFPKDMYHETLDPVQALHADHEKELRELGYGTFYIPRHYPKTLYRRNFDERYKLQKDPATLAILNHEFVESRIVRSKEQEAELLKAKTPRGCGPWCSKVTDIDPIPDGPEEDPQVTIARLEGQLHQVNQERVLAAAGKGK